MGASEKPSTGRQKKCKNLRIALAGAVLILEILDPGRPLGRVFVLLALAMVCAAVAAFLPRL